jgi:transcriptional regulator with PAS, ATPase and Fis domain
MIKKSRERSKSFGINEDIVFSRTFIEGDALRDRILKNKALIVTAEPFMNQLYDFVRGSDFFAILTDADGCILSLIGDDEILKLAHDLKMIPGAFMDERNIGTNAMGLALAEGVPVQVSGKEHTISAYYRWTCSSSTIKDDAGKVIGTLDLTGYIENVHPHTLGMVVAAVNAIENTMKLKAKNRMIKENAKFTESLLDAIQAVIISCDVSGKIKTVNKQAYQFFDCSQQDLENKPVQNYIERFNEIVECSQAGIEFQNEDVALVGHAHMAFANVSSYPVWSDHHTIDVIILVLKDVRKVRKMANEIMGRRAIYTFDKIIGTSQKMKEIIEFGEQVADSKSTVLLTGESGTGKEIFAHAIHNHSQRKNKNFVVLNCAAIPRSLIESELFGYEEGSFTGAKRGGHPGKFEIADGGTIFLDEIGEMPLDMQTKLLRVIQEGVVSRVGSSSQFPVDVRIIAATNKDLYEEVTKGNFRLDLYYRLKVLPIYLPALRHRSEDIPLMTTYFINKISKRLNKAPIKIPADYMEKLMRYNWPGNVRELENIVELMLNTRKLPELETTDQILPERYHMDTELSPEITKLDDFEKCHIENILKLNDYNLSSAAKMLGIGRNTLYRKIEKYQLHCSN